MFVILVLSPFFSWKRPWKLIEQLKSGFKRTINWDKYKSKISTERLNQHLGYLIDSIFQGIFQVNEPFVLSFADNAQETRHTECCLPNVETKGYNIMIKGENSFDQPIKNDLTTYVNFGNFATLKYWNIILISKKIMS